MPSFLNGLSALGAGVASYAGAVGLEAQKAALAQQQTVLADQLATTRETGLQTSAGNIAATAAGVQQAFQAGQTATTEAGSTARNTATIAGSAANTAAEQAGLMARTQAQINAPPDTIKLLRALGVPLPGGAPSSGGSSSAGGGAASGASTPTSGASSGAGSGASTTTGPSGAGSGATTTASDASGTTPGASTSTPASSGTGSGGTALTTADPMDNPLVKKLLGYPEAGSDDALRRAVAADVKNDPSFKYQTAGQQATETELRVNVAKGTMTSPATQLANATLIASYQIKPPDGFALTRQGGAETMAMVGKLNPGYQESRFPEINKAMGAFGAGKQGDITRSLDVGVQHLNVLDQAAAALGNGDVQKLNGLKNYFAQNFGTAAPTTFEGLKQIVATEVEKSVAGGIGSAGDRDRLMQSLDRANSPAQLQAMTDGFRSLMTGQLNGLKTQYENDTGFKGGPFAFENKLGSETLKALTAHSGVAPPPAAPIPSWVKPGDQYSPSRGQARGSDGSLYGSQD